MSRVFEGGNGPQLTFATDITIVVARWWMRGWRDGRIATAQLCHML